MILYLERRRFSLPIRILSFFICFSFILTSLFPTPAVAQSIAGNFFNLPHPGVMLNPSTGYIPPMIKGVVVHPENPLQFDFIVNTGDEELSEDAVRLESDKLIKYFLSALTVPEKEIWVNLSPYEGGKMIPSSFGQTEMGRDLLAQDYLLKQLTASLMYPENDLGQKFWDRVYKKAYDKFGTTDIPMNTFNKVWIVPEDAVVYQNGNTAYVLESRLKVMLEEDYLAYSAERIADRKEDLTANRNPLIPEIIREVLIPEIEKEINTGKTFANLRQMYNSMILATWFKLNLKESLLGQVYVNQNKTKGVDQQDKQANQKIYNRYLEAFRVGVYDYIKEDYDPYMDELIPRKYFSGGYGSNAVLPQMVSQRQITGAPADLSSEQRRFVQARLDPATGKDFINRVNLLEIGTQADNTELAKARQGLPQVADLSAEKDILDKPIRELRFPRRRVAHSGLQLWTRIENALSKNGIKTIGQLIQKTEDDLYEMGLGENAVELTITGLARKDLELSEIEPDEAFLNEPITVLRITKKRLERFDSFLWNGIEHILHENGIFTVQQLVQMTDAQVLGLEGMGRKSLYAIEVALERRGFDLKPVEETKYTSKAHKLRQPIAVLELFSKLGSQAQWSHILGFLEHEGLITIGDLTEKTYKEVLKINGISKLRLSFLESGLREMGLSLRDPSDRRSTAKRENSRQKQKIYRMMRRLRANMHPFGGDKQRYSKIKKKRRGEIDTIYRQANDRDGQPYTFDGLTKRVLDKIKPEHRSLITIRVLLDAHEMIMRKGDFDYEYDPGYYIVEWKGVGPDDIPESLTITAPGKKPADLSSKRLSSKELAKEIRRWGAQSEEIDRNVEWIAQNGTKADKKRVLDALYSVANTEFKATDVDYDHVEQIWDGRIDMARDEWKGNVEAAIDLFSVLKDERAIPKLEKLIDKHARYRSVVNKAKKVLSQLKGDSDLSSETEQEERIADAVRYIEGREGLDYADFKIQKDVKYVLKRLRDPDDKFKLKGENVDILPSTSLFAEPVGSIDRNVAEALGLIHQTANAVVLTPDGQILLQRRAHNKNSAKALTIIGGHLTAGQGYTEAMEGEIVEKLQLDPKVGLTGVLEEVEGFDVYDYRDDKNRERRKLFIYRLSDDEYARVSAFKKDLDQKRQTMSEENFKKYLEQEQKKGQGGGEVWSLHFMDPKDIFKNKEADTFERRNGNKIPNVRVIRNLDGEDAYYTPDLLNHLFADVNKELLANLLWGIEYFKYQRKLTELIGKSGEELNGSLPGRRDKKYDPGTLDVLPFEGVSVIHNISSDEAKRMRLSEVAQRLRDALTNEFKIDEHEDLAKMVAFVDLDSFHATTFDLINEPETREAFADAERNPKRLTYPEVRQNVEEATREFLTNGDGKGYVVPNGLSARVRITGIGMFAPAVIKLNLEIQDEKEKEAFRIYREKLQAYLEEKVEGYKELVRPKLGSLAGHITIGYVMNPVSEASVERFVNTLRWINRQFSGPGKYANIEFDLTKGEITEFTDMNTYKPKPDVGLSAESKIGLVVVAGEEWKTEFQRDLYQVPEDLVALKESGINAIMIDLEGRDLIQQVSNILFMGMTPLVPAEQFDDDFKVQGNLLPSQTEKIKPYIVAESTEEVLKAIKAGTEREELFVVAKVMSREIEGLEDQLADKDLGNITVLVHGLKPTPNLPSKGPSRADLSSERSTTEVLEEVNADLNTMLTVSNGFAEHAQQALRGESSSLGMLPAYISNATGQEEGEFIAIDWGGSNLRIMKVLLTPGQPAEKREFFKYEFTEEDKTLDKETLFGKVASFMQELGLDSEREYALGFTFGFALDHKSIDSAIVLAKHEGQIGKGWDVEGLVGSELGEVLQLALNAAGLENIKVKAILNDTVGTQLTVPGASLGVIYGTGVNISLVGPDGKLINSEAGGLDGFEYSTDIDNLIYQGMNPLNAQKVEKMISGGFIGEVARLILVQAYERGEFLGRQNLGSSKFLEKGGISSELLSDIEKAPMPMQVAQVLSQSDLFKGARITREDAQLAQEVARNILRRSARLAAGLIVGALKVSDPNFEREHIVAIDGSVYGSNASIREYVDEALIELLGEQRARQVTLQITKDGSGIGAAIAAAVAQSSSSDLSADIQDLSSEKEDVDWDALAEATLRRELSEEAHPFVTEDHVRKLAKIMESGKDYEVTFTPEGSHFRDGEDELTRINALLAPDFVPSQDFGSQLRSALAERREDILSGAVSGEWHVDLPATIEINALPSRRDLSSESRLPASAEIIVAAEPQGNRTKIVATIGPASDSSEMIEQLILAGVDLFRLNYSHIDTDELYEKALDIKHKIRTISRRLKRPVGILQDLGGPKIRTSKLNKAINVQIDDTLIFYPAGHSKASIDGEAIAIEYDGDILTEIQVGEVIALNDGNVKMHITEIVEGSHFKAKADIGGMLDAKKNGINLPSSNLSVRSLTEKDRADFIRGFEAEVDLVALSFIRTAQDVQDLIDLIMEYKLRYAEELKAALSGSSIQNLDHLLKERIGQRIQRPDVDAIYDAIDRLELADDGVKEDLKTKFRRIGTYIPIVAKIETPQAVENIDEILKLADVIMVARGDYVAETEISKLPQMQKRLIRKAREAGKPVIIATQVLSGMEEGRAPTRSDAVAIHDQVAYDQVDAQMLSGETAKLTPGDPEKPLRAVRFLEEMTREAERSELTERREADSIQFFDAHDRQDVVSAGAVAISNFMADTHAVVVFTGTGNAARLVAQKRPAIPVIAITRRPRVARMLNLIRNVHPVAVEYMPQRRGDFHDYAVDVTIKVMGDQINQAVAEGKKFRIVMHHGDPERSSSSHTVTALDITKEIDETGGVRKIKKGPKALREELLNRPATDIFDVVEGTKAEETRMFKLFRREGIRTLGDLVAYSENELRAIPNFGDRSAKYVKSGLAEFGLKLRDPFSKPQRGWQDLSSELSPEAIERVKGWPVTDLKSRSRYNRQSHKRMWTIIFRTLEQEGITTVGDLIELSEKEILDLDGIWHTSLNAIKSGLESIELSLPGSEADLSSESELIVDIKDGDVAWVTMNRPGSKNAFSTNLLTLLNNDLKRLNADPGVETIVLTGIGNVFSAGADLKERKGMTEEQRQSVLRLINEVFDGVANSPKTTVAAMNGSAYGGGLEFALAADYRIVVKETVSGDKPAKKTVLALPEVGLGIIPGAGGTQRLPKIIDPVLAKKIILRGQPIDVGLAERIGLIDAIVDSPADFEEAVQKVLSSSKRSVSYERGIDKVLGSGYAYKLDVRKGDKVFDRDIAYVKLKRVLEVNKVNEAPAADTLNALAQDTSVRAVVFEGDPHDYVTGHEMSDVISRFPKPTVAVIAGGLSEPGLKLARSFDFHILWSVDDLMDFEEADTSGYVDRKISVGDNLPLAIDHVLHNLKGVAPVSYAMAKLAVVGGLETEDENPIATVERPAYEIARAAPYNKMALQAFAQKEKPQYAWDAEDMERVNQAVTSLLDDFDLSSESGDASRKKNVLKFIDQSENPYWTNMRQRVGSLRQHFDVNNPMIVDELLNPYSVFGGWAEEEFAAPDGKVYKAEFFHVRVNNNRVRGPGKGGIRWVLASDLLDETQNPEFIEAFARLNALHPKRDQVKQFIAKWITGEANALSLGMTLKNAGNGLPLGGGKGTIFIGDIVRNGNEWTLKDYESWKDMDPNNKAKIARRHSLEMAKAGKIGIEIDIPAPDVRTNPQILSWYTDEYLRYLVEETDEIEQADPDLQSRLKPITDNGPYEPSETPYLKEAYHYYVAAHRPVPWIGVYTGKPVDLGGSLGRTEATGEGVADVMHGIFGGAVKGKTVAVQGFGNGAQYFSLRAVGEFGVRLQYISDTSAALFSDKGFTFEQLTKLTELKNNKVSLREAFEKNLFDRDDVTLETDKSKLAETVLEADVDFLVPSALENAITKENADRIKADWIFELANGATDLEGEEILTKRRKRVIPDTLANAGGVSVSYEETEQVKAGKALTKEEVAERRNLRLISALRETQELKREKKDGVTFRMAFDILAVKNIIKAKADTDLSSEGDHFTSWRVWPYGDGVGTMTLLEEFDSMDSLKASGGDKLIGTAEQKKERLRVLQEAIERFEDSTIGEEIFGKGDGWDVRIRVNRNVYIRERKRSVTAKSEKVDDRLILTIEESVLGNGSEDPDDHAAAVLLTQTHLYHLGLAHVLSTNPAVNGVNDKIINAFILLKELEFIHYHPDREKLIALLESKTVNRIANPFLKTLSRYKNRRINTIVHEVQVPSEEIAIINGHLEDMYGEQFDRQEEKSGLIRLLEVLGDYYFEQGDYRQAIRQYSHGLFYSPHNPTLRSKVKKTVEASVDAISAEDKRDFLTIWNEPSSKASEMWEKVQEITLVNELRYLPESFRPDGTVATRYDQVDEAVTFLNYLDSTAIAFNPSIANEDFFKYLNAKRLQDKELNEGPILKFIETYRSVAKDDSNNKNDSTRKILRLAAMLLQYSRVLHGDESLDAWEVLPKFLKKLGLDEAAREQVMALTSLHRNFGTLYFGEGSPSFTSHYLEQVKGRLKGIEDGHGAQSGGAVRFVREVKLNPDQELMSAFVEALDEDDVYSAINNLRHEKAEDGEVKGPGALFTLIPFMEELADATKFTKSPGVSIFDHTMELVRFLSLIEKGDDKSFAEINSGKKGRLIRRDVFDGYHREFHKWLGEPGTTERSKSRRLIYLGALLHDSGEWRLVRGEEVHEEKSAEFIPQVLEQLGLVKGAAADTTRFLFDQEDVDFISWLALSHVDLGTIRFGERTIGKLYDNPIRDPNQSPEDRARWVKALSFINTSDVYGTRQGVSLNQDHFDHFFGIISDDDYLEREFSAGLFDRRIKIWSSDPPGELDRPKFRKVNELLDQIRERHPEDYTRITENFGRPERYKVLDYAIFFMQSLRAEDMVKLMYLLSTVSDVLEREGTEFDTIIFTAPSALAPFSADPINEIMKNYSFKTIHDLSKKSFEEIQEDLKSRGNLDIRMNKDGKLVVDNKKLADLNRYIKLASISAAAWVISKARNVTTDNHIESLVFLHNLTKLPTYRQLENNWSKIRLFLGLFGEGRVAINLEKASKLFDGLSLQETVILLIFMNEHYSDMDVFKKTGKGMNEGEFFNKMNAIEGGKELLRAIIPGITPGNWSGNREKKAKLKKLSEIVVRLMRDNEMTAAIRKVAEDVREVNSELERIKAVSDKRLDGFENFLSRVNIKNGIWNFREFSERSTHKLSVFRWLYVLYRLSDYYQSSNGHEINVIKFSHELDTNADSEFNVIESVVDGLMKLKPEDLEKIIKENPDPFKAVTDILGLKGRGISIEDDSEYIDTMFVDLRSVEELRQFEDAVVGTTTGPSGELSSESIGILLLPNSEAQGLLSRIKSGEAYDGKGSRRLHVVMGGEAADLDSVVAAIVYAVDGNQGAATDPDSDRLYVPLINIPKAKFRLRTDVVQWLRRVGITEDDLLFTDTFDVVDFLKDANPEQIKGRGFEIEVSIMDHSQLASYQQHLMPYLIRVIDHHPGGEALRDMVRSSDWGSAWIDTYFGSATTMVALIVTDMMRRPPSKELAQLMAGTILKDTANLGDPDRTSDYDRRVVEYLLPIAGLDQDETSNFIKDTLFDISELSLVELLDRDYKTGSLLGLPDSIGIASITGGREDKLTAKGNVQAAAQEFLAGLGREERPVPNVLVGMNFDLNDDAPPVREMFVYSPNPVFISRLAEFLRDDSGRDVPVELEDLGEESPNLVWFGMNRKVSRKKILPALNAFFAQAGDYTLGNPLGDTDLSSETVGGIDLNPELLDLQIKRGPDGIPLPLPQQPIHQMKIDGFLPVIINVTPISSVPLLLGFVPTPGSDKEISASELMPAEPLDKLGTLPRARFEREDVSVELQQVSLLN